MVYFTCGSTSKVGQFCRKNSRPGNPGSNYNLELFHKVCVVLVNSGVDRVHGDFFEIKKISRRNLINVLYIRLVKEALVKELSSANSKVP